MKIQIGEIVNHKIEIKFIDGDKTFTFTASSNHCRLLKSRFETTEKLLRAAEEVLEAQKEYQTNKDILSYELDLDRYC